MSEEDKKELEELESEWRYRMMHRGQGRVMSEEEEQRSKELKKRIDANESHNDEIKN